MTSERLDDEPAGNGGARCLNCGESVGPRFCGTCGQAVEDRRQPLLGLIRELVEEWLSVDGRLIHTLRALPFPGRLTVLYLSGKRAPFINPLRLYLLASVILFSSVLTLRPPKVEDVNLYIDDILIGERHVEGRGTVTFRSPSFGLNDVETPGMANLGERLRALPPQQVLDSFFNGIRDALPIGLILFVPLLALALKGLYVRSHVLYVDHLIFAVHFQSALFLALATLWVIARVVGFGFLGSVLMYIPGAFLMLTVYLGWALGRVYGESRWRTAGKTTLLLFAYLVLLRQTIGIPILLVLSRI